MKKLIYLPLITIIILSGCKGNSFITQRYTKYSHASHKISQKGNPVTKTTIPSTTTVDEKIVDNEEIEPGLMSSNSSSIKENILKSDVATHIYSARAKISKPEVLNSDNLKLVHKSKKTSHEKKQAAKRIIGTLLKIVLWVIILAVVVGVLLIIGALA
ncbi:MAG: hypothetical protein H0U95_00835 [Bacteroidetes bacterium]|nr:hypothetical protein [Bacteroidota bacterium]